MLPWKPEPVETLRQRFHLAVDHLHDQRDELQRKLPRLVDDRAHVFDTEDGVRIVPCIEDLRAPNGKLARYVLHIAYVLRADSRLGIELAADQDAAARFVNTICPQAFAAVCSLPLLHASEWVVRVDAGTGAVDMFTTVPMAWPVHLLLFDLWRMNGNGPVLDQSPPMILLPGRN